ncbi:DMP19 family protein [Luteolibacter soli]|uniref:DUF4375 domain-containing protein n=1 Tax=Luteolibacter soli TaxID=3135280 RepID=A0ABU9ANC4_9BACT
MNRRLLVTIGLLLIAGVSAQDKPPVDPPSPPKQEHLPIPADWPGVEYAEVRAYLYNPGDNAENLILENGKLHAEVVNPEGIKLDATHTERLLATFRGKAPDGAGVGCFTPHHGFVFYDRDGKPVADVTACFLCEIGVANPGSHSMTTWEFNSLARLVQDLGLPVFKDPTEAEAHFIGLARHWPDAKVKAAIDKYLFDGAKENVMDRSALVTLLQGLGERTHPFLLAYLADENLRTGWLKKDPAAPFMGTLLGRLCDSFGDTPPAAVIPLLAPLLDGADVAARCKAAEVIAKTGVPELIPQIRKALADSREDLSDALILPPPTSDEKPPSSGITVYRCAFAGLQVALDRGTLHPEAKDQLFPDVKALGGIFDEQGWAKALIQMNSNRAMEFFLSPEMFNPDSPRLSAVMRTLCEMNLQIPRERLLTLCGELRSKHLGEDQKWIMKPALLLLGRQRHPDDLELLRGMGDETLASDALAGLLAWHGLEGYRERLAKQESEKGFAALNEPQRLHFAAEKFDSIRLCFGNPNIGGYFSGAGGEQWRDALAGLKALKQDALAAILEEAVAKFGEEGPDKDAETRRKQIAALEEKHAFDELEARLQEATNQLDLSLDRFAIEHAESFK